MYLAWHTWRYQTLLCFQASDVTNVVAPSRGCLGCRDTRGARDHWRTRLTDTRERIWWWWWTRARLLPAGSREGRVGVGRVGYPDLLLAAVPAEAGWRLAADGLAGYLAVLHLSAGRVEHLEGVVSPRERTLEHSKTAQRERRVVCNDSFWTVEREAGNWSISQSMFGFTAVDSKMVSDRNEIQSKNFIVLVNYINLLTGPRTISLATEVMAAIKNISYIITGSKVIPIFTNLIALL